MIPRKKTWPRLLTYIVLLLSLTREVSAVEIVASNVRGAPGEQVLVSVELAEATGTASASFSLGYDATQLTLKQTSLGDLGERFDLASFNPDTPGQFTASFLSATGITAASGSLVTLSFAISEQALSDSVALTLSAIEFTDREADPLPTSAIHGYIQISIVPAPIADFTASLIEANVQKTIAFTSESTGEITSLEWDFGDGATSTESQTSHAFQDTGIYAVSLTVNGPGGSDTHTLDIIILVPAPIADFTASLIEANVQKTIAFTSESTGEITSLEWDFGDGTWRRDDQLRIRTESQTIHTFQDTGTYAVSLTVNGPGGSDTHTLDVIIGFSVPSAISPTTFSSDLAPIPEHFVLHPNFPNPFNAITTIRYELPIMINGAFTSVYLAIYNLMGQKIRTLLDQPQKSGYHKITWNGIDDYGLPVSSGVYFYRIAVGDQIQSRPLLLLR